MFSKAYFWTIIFFALFWTSELHGGLLSPRTDSAPAYHITADSLSYDDITKTYKARGYVSITKGNQSLHADAIDFNKETKEAKAWVLEAGEKASVSKDRKDSHKRTKIVGWWDPALDILIAEAAPEAWDKVYFFSGKDWVTGNRIEIDMDKGTGVVYDGTLFIEESHFYIKGDEIQKTGKDSYYVKDDVSFTTCDGDSPAWQITGKDLRVTIEGYGTLKHATLRAKSIPILYVPYMLFPAKIKRQTGLLAPLILYSNTNGLEYIQPFFWAINDSSDATFYEHYMAHRGFKHGLEYRYVLSAFSKGTLMYDFLYDKQIDDGTTPSNSSGYHYEGFRGDSENRLNRKRWWFRMKNDWGLPAGFNAKLDIDVVSDQDYLREFDTIYSGYYHSDQYFLDEFGRGLDDKTDTVRLNQLNVSRSWNQFSLNTDFRWYDNVIARKHNRDDSTLQKLPTVSFSASKQEIPSFPFYFDLTSSLNHFWRDVGTRGYSAELYPRVYYPTTIFKYFDLEPSVGLNETVWQVERYEPESPQDEDKLKSRQVGDFKVDLSTEISRIFDPGNFGTDKIRHAIKPQAVYTYVQDVDQDDIPGFVDSIDEESMITYSITNTFTSRKVEKAKSGSVAMYDIGQDQVLTPPKFHYHDFCRIKLSQSYDILEATRSTREAEKRRPFSDVEGRLELSPTDAFELAGNTTWSAYHNDFTSCDAILTMKDKRGDSASIDYQYKQYSTESVITKISFKLFNPLSGYWEHEYNLREQEDVKSVLGFAYEPQCWSFFVKYTDDRTGNKREYFFEISLYGLGKYGLGK